MTRCRKILHKLLHIFKKKAPKYSAIPCLDERILENIYQHLSLVDQVCLSLSCKDLFSLFGKIVKHKDLEFPRLLRIRIPILCVNSPHVLRNQLLLRLENHRWAYCAKCLKLHPRAEFTEYSLRKSALERSCTFEAGIVDLCPCISLTGRGRDRLIKILKSPATPAKTKYGPFEYDFDDRKQPGLRHACLFSTQSGYDVEFAANLFLNESGQLCVTGRHTIIFYYPDAHLTAEPTFACPHLELLRLIPDDQNVHNSLMQRILNHSKPHQDLLSLVPQTLAPKACPTCQTLVAKYPLPEDMKQADFWVVRNLGGCGWPADYPWSCQCRNTGVLFLTNKIYW
jgi:hypothetical protein